MTQTRAAFVAFGAALLLSRCGGSPIAPPPPPPPPPPPNAAPVVRSVTVSRTQVEADQEVDAVATVEDAETPADQLEYVWSAAKGMFSGTGRSVRWRAPRNEPSPADYTLTVTVVERYPALNAQGQPVTAEHRVPATSPSIRVNDSPRELRILAETFLTDFANSSVTPEHAVRNFSDTCAAKKAAEISDIRFNRETRTITSSRITVTSISIDTRDFLCFDVPVRCALINVACEFRSTVKATGQSEFTQGECVLTGIYEEQRWSLCESRFFGTVSSGLRFAR